MHRPLSCKFIPLPAKQYLYLSQVWLGIKLCFVIMYQNLYWKRLSVFSHWNEACFITHFHKSFSKVPYSSFMVKALEHKQTSPKPVKLCCDWLNNQTQSSPLHDFWRTVQSNKLSTAVWSSVQPHSTVYNTRVYVSVQTRPHCGPIRQVAGTKTSEWGVGWWETSCCCIRQQHLLWYWWS